MFYQIVEIISNKTKKSGMVCFNSDKELKEWLDGRRAWNEGNKQYSIVAWNINHTEAAIDLTRYGYKPL